MTTYVTPTIDSGGFRIVLLDNQANNKLKITPVSISTKAIPAPLVIAHIVATLGIGGIERWLLDIVSQNPSDNSTRPKLHIITLFGDNGNLSHDFFQAGALVSYVPFQWSRLLVSMNALLRFFRDSRCNVVHCHVDYLAGIVLPLAWLVGCRCRVVHVHSTTFPLSSSRSPCKRALAWTLRKFCGIFATHIVGCSEVALLAFNVPGNNPKRKIIHCSIPIHQIERVSLLSRQEIRTGLDWMPDWKVILHVGRHAPQKNLEFALEVFRCIAESDPRARMIFAGTGDETTALREKSKQLGLGDRVIFLGNRSDVFELMHAADLMLFPSLYEGLPVTLIEAQASGLPILMSDTITNEVCVIDKLVYSMPLCASPAAWATQAIHIMQLPRLESASCLTSVAKTDFNLDYANRSLQALYLGSFK